jgi:hypothetical protein
LHFEQDLRNYLWKSRILNKIGAQLAEKSDFEQYLRNYLREMSDFEQDLRHFRN